MWKLDPLRILPRRVLDVFEGDPMSLARVRIALVGILLPYLARLPGAVIHGTDWLSPYLQPDIAHAMSVQGFNTIGWGSLVLSSYLVNNRAVLVAPALLGFGFMGHAHANVRFEGSPFDGVEMVFIPIYALPIMGVAFVLSMLAFGADPNVEETERPPTRHLESGPDGTRTPVRDRSGVHSCFACGAKVNFGASECRRCEQPFEYDARATG